ncbi:DUF2165 family protein [Sphingomonas bacterium]|uniref:DUF2165 family protein n=1 Tax=Sphingomonas bacterium TaxID=1895847 RepID=UPI001C2DA453|nr:DUF2165 family protein [Sphingomonas bacterium]
MRTVSWALPSRTLSRAQFGVLRKLRRGIAIAAPLLTSLCATDSLRAGQLAIMTIGGEWFLMWQSTVWNGQESAFRFYTTILLVLVYFNQPDGDLRLIRVDPAPADEVSLLGCKVDR